MSLFSVQNSNSIVPDISNPVLEEPADISEELFFPNMENSNIGKDSSKGDLEYDFWNTHPTNIK